MKKQLAPPANWAQFEDLCKILYAIKYNAEDIEKGGVSGQKQQGVDIYFKPFGRNEYWGIQCKGKDHYNKGHLTFAEIDSEIAKAKEFKPALKKFIFATTAKNDSKIQEYIRQKDFENVESGLFGIAIHSWDSISDIIHEFPEAYTRFLGKTNEGYNVEVRLLNKAIKPTFLVNKIINQHNPYLAGRLRGPRINYIDEIIEQQKPYVPQRIQMNPISLGGNSKNLSFCKVKLKISNIGFSVFEDWKLVLTLPDNIHGLDNDSPTILMGVRINDHQTTWYDFKSRTVKYLPLDSKPLVQNDTREFVFYILPSFVPDPILIKWNLIARNFNKKGELNLEIEPQYEYTSTIMYVKTIEEAIIQKEISFYETSFYDEEE